MTKFNELYERLYGRISDYELLEYDEVTRNRLMQSLLLDAVDDFAPVCKQDIEDYDTEMLCFSADLSGTEKEILVLYMMCHWLEPRVMNSDLLRNALNTKDFSLYSHSNLLEKMSELLETTRARVKNLVNLYTFRGSEIAALTQ